MLIDTKLAPLRKGLLEFVVLRIVGGNQVYVPDILKRLSGTEFATQEGTLYPLLSKLRREQLVEYEWRESELGPPRKYYRLSADGRRELDARLEEFGDAFVEDFLQFVHRTPRPRAMMPRRISSVPPRSENDGASCVRLPRTCW